MLIGNSCICWWKKHRKEIYVHVGEDLFFIQPTMLLTFIFVFGITLGLLQCGGLTRRQHPLKLLIHQKLSLKCLKYRSRKRVGCSSDTNLEITITFNDRTFLLRDIYLPVTRVIGRQIFGHYIHFTGNEWKLFDNVCIFNISIQLEKVLVDFLSAQRDHIHHDFNLVYTGCQ